MSFTLVNKKTGKQVTFTRKSATPPFPNYRPPSKTNGEKLAIAYRKATRKRKSPKKRK